jgi:hypothetical protein
VPQTLPGTVLAGPDATDQPAQSVFAPAAPAGPPLPLQLSPLVCGHANAGDTFAPEFGYAKH